MHEKHIDQLCPFQVEVITITGKHEKKEQGKSDKSALTLYYTG